MFSTLAFAIPYYSSSNSGTGGSASSVSGKNSVSTSNTGGGTSFASNGIQSSTNGGVPVKVTETSGTSGTGNFPAIPSFPAMPSFPSAPVTNQKSGATYYK